MPIKNSGKQRLLTKRECLYACNRYKYDSAMNSNLTASMYKYMVSGLRSQGQGHVTIKIKVKA